MKVCHILFCFIFLAAQEDGTSGRVNAETSPHRRVEGESVTFECSFVIPGNTKFFCKEECENGNILIETTDDTFQSGKYSMEYVRKGSWKYDIMYVSITQLKTSDSGWYRCYLDTTLKTDYFELVVTEASKPLTTDVPLKPVSTTTTQSLNFGSGGSTPPSASTEIVKHSETPAGSGKLLYVIPVLVTMITLLSAALLIFYKRKKSGTKLKGPPVEPEYADITQTNQLYEETREADGPSSSPAAGVSSVYAYPKSCQRNTAENLQLYSLVTSPQNKAEDEMNELNYAVVDFSHIPATSSAPCGETAEVLYSTPLMAASPAHHTPPLYSRE